jgi:signal transduction histidine kinase
MKPWWRSRTLRFRLAVWYGAGGSLLLAAFSATLYAYVSERMARPLGQELRADLAEVQRKFDVRPDGLMFWERRQVESQTRWTTEYPWFEVWDHHGRLVGRFWPFTGSRLSELPRAPMRRTETISIYYVAPDIRIRSLSAAFQPAGRGEEWSVRVMRLHEPAADALLALRWIIAIALPVVIGLLVIGGYAITRRWLSPLADMVAEAQQITPDERGRRLPVINPNDELGQLGTVFNDTLDRLQSAFDTLDRFVADASHELRTPLASLRSVGEIGLRCNRSVEEANEVISSMLEEAHRLEVLVQRLLQLANAEGGPMFAQRGPVALEECVTEVAEGLRALAHEKNQRIIVAPLACRVTTDLVLLRQALHNLVENGIKYSPSGATIHVDMVVDEKEVSIAVADEGPGIRMEDRDNLMKRFFRPSRGRDRETGGYGLGLSITKAFMRVLGGNVRYSPREPTGSVFSLTLPRS